MDPDCAQMDLEKIFDVFYKSDRSRHDKSSTGLGLAICRKVVGNHGEVSEQRVQDPVKVPSLLFYFPYGKCANK